MPAIHIPNRTGTGTIWFRADYELVGRTLAAKLRQRTDRSGVGDAIDFAPHQRKAQ